MRHTCFAAITVFVCSPALAQEESNPYSSIIVTGRGLTLPPGTPAYGSTIITRERLTSVASERLETVLADVAGFQQFRRSDSRSSNPSAQGATLRALGGNASSRTLVLLDGVPMADPFFGYIPFSAIIPDRLAGVRITRGGGVGAFGAGAVAGTIELDSAVRTDLATASGSVAYGSRDSREFSAGVTPDLGQGYVSISGRWDRGDGFYTTPRNQRTIADVPARYDGWSTNLRAVAPVGDDVEIQARALIFDDDRTLRFARANSHSEGQDASIRLIARGAWQVDALAYVQARNFSNVVISSTSFRKTLDQRNTPSTGIGGKIEVRPPVGPDHVLRVGVDTRIASGDMFEDAYNATSGLVTARRHAFGRQSTTGLFVENDWTIGKLILTGGARADRWTITDGQFEVRSAAGALTADTLYPDRNAWKFSGRAGALIRASNVFALRAAGYTGFRLPTLNELYRPFAVFPVTTQANAALGLEKLKGAEVGADVMPLPGVTFAATAFYNRLGNAVANVTIGTNLRQRQNVDAIVAKGIELTGSARLENWSLLASYAYSHAAVRAPGKPFDGLVPAQSPRHAVAATLSWEPVKGASLSTTLRYVSRQYEDDLQTDALPGAVTLDAFARFPIASRVAIIGRAENIFDKAVVTRNAGGSIDLGTPRTLWIGFHFEG